MIFYNQMQMVQIENENTSTYKREDQRIKAFLYFINNASCFSRQELARVPKEGLKSTGINKKNIRYKKKESVGL